MTLQQQKNILLRSHTAQRNNNALTNTAEWKVLRFQHSEEVKRIGLMLVSLTDWLRQKKEIKELGLCQKLYLNSLLTNHALELDAINRRIDRLPYVVQVVYS